MKDYYLEILVMFSQPILNISSCVTCHVVYLEDSIRSSDENLHVIILHLHGWILSYIS